ncbi:MAG: alpha/beta hydrolase [Proteobacteria bacterium]|nr:alpha/beta hydrolase [Pseudomonadota bacterium]
MQLNVVEKGRGHALVLIPGWSQTAQFYAKQLDGLSDHYRVIAIDMRGHGASPKPEHGYRIARLARDVYEFLRDQDLRDVAIAGHSMGASVLWSYLEHYGSERLGKLIFIDQSPCLTNSGNMTDQEILEAGAVFTPESLYTTARRVANEQAAALADFEQAFFSAEIGVDDIALYTRESLKMPSSYAARLLIDHGSQDWRDVIRHVIPALKLPTLIVGGALGTIVPPQAMEWIAAQIPTSQLAIFSAEERGSHFMFWENPQKFNELVRRFLA